MIGKNTFDTFLSRLSSHLNLSKRYTNHCLRVTGITVLKEAGKSNEEIAFETGHKSALSVQRYVRKRKDNCHQNMSALMSSGFSKLPKKVAPFGRGKITIEEQRKICVSDNCSGSEGSVKISFCGTFNNCVFNTSHSLKNHEVP